MAQIPVVGPPPSSSEPPRPKPQQMKTPDFRAYADDLRRAHTLQPLEWVLNPWEYDFFKAHVESGTASEDVKRFFAACVRVEPMEP